MVYQHRVSIILGGAWHFLEKNVTAYFMFTRLSTHLIVWHFGIIYFVGIVNEWINNGCCCIGVACSCMQWWWRMSGKVKKCQTNFKSFIGCRFIDTVVYSGLESSSCCLLVLTMSSSTVWFIWTCLLSHARTVYVNTGLLFFVPYDIHGLTIL